MDQRTAAAQLFDRLAPTYDQVGVALFGPVAELLVAELAPRPGERVLDVGCGRGAVLLRAALRAGAAHGLDASPAMVAAARELAAEQGLDVDVEVDDAVAPQRRASSYDVVAASLVLPFLPDPLVALQAWHALLRPGGRLGVTSFGPVTPAWQAVDDVVLAAVPGGRDPRRAARSGPFSSDAGVEGLLLQAGCAQVRTCTAVVPLRFRDEDHWYRWSWSVAQRAGWEAVPEAERPAVRSRAQELLRAARLPDGQLGCDQVVRATLGRRAP